MEKFLESLRKKPDHEKKSIALVTSLCLTLVIAITWGTLFLSNLPKRFVSEEQKVEIQRQESNVASPMAAIGSQFNELKVQLSEIREFVETEFSDLEKIEE